MEYAAPDTQFVEHGAPDMGGAPPQSGMAPYPLYGIPSALGQEEPAQPFYKKPWFCYSAGAAAGFGIGWFIFGWLKPRMKPNPKRKKKAEG